VIVLLDTDILVDLALDRRPYAATAAALVDSLEKRRGNGFVAWHTMSNFYYLVAPSRGKDGAQRFLMELSQFIDVAPTTTDSLRLAGRLEMNDFEDAMQVAAAVACRADVIATRNLRDYAKAPVKAQKPESVLALLA
jgi:predicted nucleic acid-binding protein